MKTLRIGIISDTHGLLRPEAEKHLAGVDHIIHGGDIGRPDVLVALRRIARSRQSGATWTLGTGRETMPTPNMCGSQRELSTSSTTSRRFASIRSPKE
jgi:hypothetical protein